MKMNKGIIIDYIMLLLLFPLMLKPLFGLAAHELMGLCFLIFVAMHCLNHKRWAKNIWQAVQKKSLSPLKIASIIINGLLVAAVLLVAASGIMISIVVFGFLDIPYHEVFYRIHTAAAQAILLLSLVHLGMHMKMIIAFLRNKKRERRIKSR